LLWFVGAAAGVLAGAGGTGVPSAGGASAEELLARALEVIERQAAEIRELREENTQLKEQNAQLVRVSEELRELVGEQAARLAEANESLAVLQRMVFGRKSEKDRPEPAGTCDGDDSAGDGGGEEPSGGKKKVKRGLGARSGRRGYSHLPRVEIIWDFPGGGYWPA
jgi:transposase